MTVRTLLVTDVVDSTKVAEQLGDAAMAALWAAHDRVARDLLVVHHGREIDKTDGFLLLFDEPANAVAYAVAYHRAIGALSPPLKARAGLHLGPVILTENAPADVARGAKPLEVDGLAKPMAARVMSVAVGGQTLLTRAVADALGSTALRTESHGHWRMKGVAEPMELFEVGDEDAPFTPPPDGAKVYRVVHRDGVWLPVREVRHNVPADRDAFVGRTQDLQTLSRLLDESRLVSVLGMGGTGKTRLVTRFAWAWLGDYPGGVWFCDLSEARSADGIVSAVARSLEVRLGQADAVSRLGHVIAGRGPCLVVLDNFEQVARYAPETLGRWLDRAHEARFVVTTREVLGLPGEVTLALPPLVSGEAVELFATRAAQAKPGFLLTEAERPTVAELVSLLDGLPLAIELAAARVRVMSPGVILQRMSERFKLLSSSGGRPTRQATLRGALDWSWDLLPSDEQSALGQLSVFEGGFTLEAAEGVLSLTGAWPVDAVQALVDKSLVRRVSDDRLDLLVSVKAYASEKLVAAGGLFDAEVRHAVCFGAYGTAEALAALDQRGGAERRRLLHLELHNLVAACARSVNRGDTAAALPLLDAACAVIELEGPAAVAIDLTERVTQLRGIATRDLGTVLVARARALYLAGRLDEARGCFEWAMEVARESGDRRLEGAVQGNMGSVYQDQGRTDEARACCEVAIRIALEFGDRRREGLWQNNLGTLLLEEGRLDEARACLDRALTNFREVGDGRNEGHVLANLGNLARAQGRSDEALANYEAGLALDRAWGNRVSESIALSNLANMHVERGRSEEALACSLASLAIQRDLGSRLNEGITLGNLGNVFRELGRVEEARDALASALAVHRELKFTYGQGYWLSGLARIEAAASHDRWRATIDEAVAVSAAFPIVQAHVLRVRVDLRLDHGDIAGARADVDAARRLGQAGSVKVAIAVVDAKTRHAEGQHDRAREALREAEALAEGAGLGADSPLGREIAALGAKMAGA